MDDEDDRYRDAFLVGVSPAVWHAYRLMTREGLADHVIVVVAADGRIEAMFVRGRSSGMA